MNFQYEEFWRWMKDENGVSRRFNEKLLREYEGRKFIFESKKDESLLEVI
jgi:hypothetical protein